jgi:hypothetical protein
VLQLDLEQPHQLDADARPCRRCRQRVLVGGAPSRCPAGDEVAHGGPPVAGHHHALGVAWRRSSCRAACREAVPAWDPLERLPARAGRRSPSPRRRRPPSSAYCSRQRPRKYARVSSGGSCDRPLDLVVVQQPLRCGRGPPGGCRGPSPAARRRTAGRPGAAWGVPVEAVASPVALQQLQLGDPVQLAGDSFIGSVAEPVEHRSQRAGRPWSAVRVVAVLVLDVLAGQLEVLRLQLDRGHLAAVLERHQVRAGRVVADLVQRGDRAVDALRSSVRSRPRSSRAPARRADLEVRRDLRQVRVADDHVQPAVLVGSACGSSRVLMIGRFSVVSRPTSTSK